MNYYILDATPLYIQALALLRKKRINNLAVHFMQTLFSDLKPDRISSIYIEHEHPDILATNYILYLMEYRDDSMVVHDVLASSHPVYQDTPAVRLQLAEKSNVQERRIIESYSSFKTLTELMKAYTQV
jgi:hypothetical protein